MSRRNRMFTARTLVLGGLAAAAAAAALKNRTKVAGLIGARSSEPEPYRPAPTSPAPAAPAAAIGGAAPDYAPSTLGETVDEADRPLEEAGEGSAEGQEQAEGLLADYAEPTAGETIEAERQIDEVIEAQEEPRSGEALET